MKVKLTNYDLIRRYGGVIVNVDPSMGSTLVKKGLAKDMEPKKENPQIDLSILEDMDKFNDLVDGGSKKEHVENMSSLPQLKIKTDVVPVIPEVWEGIFPQSCFE